MKIGLRDVAEVYLFDLKTNEVVSLFGYELDKQNKVNRLIKLRNSSKKKRLRKKLNRKIDTLLGR